ncbi:hypothetical protein [Paraburkholderia caffeinilytica]|uniref:hypothetical protein n=1 Tax=Paraburkholderia caffeinilytica TaxID=1761016 RepID=UPI003DA0EFA5
MSGYSHLPVVATEATDIWTTRKDPCGPAPKGGWTAGERAGYEKVRKSFDRVLQATRETVYVPQEGEDVQLYEARLLNDLRPHTENYQGFINLPGYSPASIAKLAPEIVHEAMLEPKREGRLVEIKLRDPYGRPFSEFEGSKASWMNHFKAVPAGEGVFIDGVRQTILAR